jgi:hypothetical protein
MEAMVVPVKPQYDAYLANTDFTELDALVESFLGR